MMHMLRFSAPKPSVRKRCRGAETVDRPSGVGAITAAAQLPFSRGPPRKRREASSERDREKTSPHRWRGPVTLPLISCSHTHNTQIDRRYEPNSQDGQHLNKFGDQTPSHNVPRRVS
eukprot:scaffold8102_cov73-Cyclotella_meneghiniana.AAC.3